MWHTPESDDLAENLLLAGQHVSAGIYRNVESGLCLQFDGAGMLPPSFDGRVACYVPIPRARERRVEALNVVIEHRSKI